MRELVRRRAVIAILAAGIVSCGGGGGGPTAPAAPTINNVGSVRAGEILVITGQNLTSLNALELAQQASVEVLVDSRVLTPESVTATEIRVRIPMDLTPGSHTLAVRVSGRTSNTINLTVEVFTVTGTYVGAGTIVSTTCNDPDLQEAFREIFPPGFTDASVKLVTDLRPQLRIVVPNPPEGDVELTGALMADGSFQATVTESLPEVQIVNTLTGQFTFSSGEVRSQSSLTLVVTFPGTPLLCDVALTFEERRTTTNLSRQPDHDWGWGGFSLRAMEIMIQVTGE